MTSEQLRNPQELAQQVMQAANSLSDEEAAQRYQQILARLPQDQAAELNALALSQVGANQRRGLATQFRQAHQNPSSPFDGYDYNDDDEAANPQNLGRMSARAQQQDPNLLGGILGQDSGLGGQIGRAALSALAALLIRRMMSGQGGQNMPGGVDIGSILGGLLGGSTNTGGYGGQGLPPRGQSTPNSADPIGSILGGILSGGGATGGQDLPQRGQTTPGGLDLGSILGGLLGGGAATRQMPQGGGDLGSIIGSILGGGNAAPDQQESGSHRKEGIYVRDDQ